MILFGGLKIGFSWVYGGDGTSSKTSALLASYHHPRSITWRWALYWCRSDPLERKRFSWSRHLGDYGWFSFSLPFFGGLSLQYQQHMFRGDQ